MKLKRKSFHEMKALLEFQAYHDDLTLLPNRRMFQTRLERRVEEAKLNKDSFALLFLDLNRFKYINDTLGHQWGDTLLRLVSSRLLSSMGADGQVFRMGGDEFAILLPHTSNQDEAVKVIQNIMNEIEKPFCIQGDDLVITFSIGVSMYPNDGEDAASLLKSADIAMYRAKHRGGNSYRFYSLTMNQYAYKMFTLEKDLRQAINKEELTLYFQPRVDARSRRIVGAEALIRWNHPKLGLISPGEFIPLAEDTGLIIPIGEWVQRTVCKRLKFWKDEGFPLVPISFNASAKQFISHRLIDKLKDDLIETGIEGKWLEIEVTESSWMENVDSVKEILQELKMLGVKTALDDFGTGYSSLNYLRKLKLDTLKIDRSFIQNVDANADGAAILKAMVQLGHSLNMKVVVEGVETELELLHIQSLDCDEIQGYYFSPAVPERDFLSQYLDGNRTI